MSGQKSVQMNGDIDITEVATLIEAIKTELEIIVMEGSPA